MIVIRVGGSLIFDEEGNLNIDFLKKLKETIKKIEGKKAIIVGGGKFVKKIMKEIKENFEVSEEDLDWIGIRFTIFNAEIIRSTIGGRLIESYEKIPEGELIIGGGEKPGYSTDYDAIYLAVKIGVKEVIKLTDVDGIFDKDPKKYKDAKLLKKLSYDDVLKISGKRVPGMKFPISPIAVELAKKNGVKIVVMNGKKLENLIKYLKGEEFVGTIIS